MSATLELFDGAFWRDPYPAYAELRADAPVRRVERADGVVWLLSRYADVRAALADPRLSKDWRYTLPPEQRAGQPGTPIPMMILMDPPEHTRLRKLVSRVFTLRRMEALRPRVREVAAELIAELPSRGPVDLMPGYALLLPVLVICELLGVPYADRDEFQHRTGRQLDLSIPMDERIALQRESRAYMDRLVAGAEATGLEVRTRVEGTPRPLPAGTDLAAFRIVQESLTNVTRHAGPASATVLVRYGPADLTVQVDDDGRGPAPGGGAGPAGTAKGNGNGIRGMRERVAALGGELTTGPRPGGGFRVQANLPIEPVDEHA